MNSDNVYSMRSFSLISCYSVTVVLCLSTD